MVTNSAIYIHIPFCDHKCIYCDFYSIITSDNIDNYLKSLKTEIEFYAAKYSRTHSFNTIYFGGGTPSLMESEYIAGIISFVKQHFVLTENAEITIETNPGTVSKQKLLEFKKAGINRISIGIQSFNEDELKFLTRIHSAETAKQTVIDAHSVGFDNISIDLIFNLPGQTREMWLSNLETAFTLPIKHISAYSLILEGGTILNKMVLDKKVILQDDDYDANLYEKTIDLITNKGMIQYEVSNFCCPGYECVHNNAYWRYRDYLSFGTSAHSFMDGKRWWNFSSLKMYIESINQSNNAVANCESPLHKQQVEEYVLLALRSSGLDLEELNTKFGGDWLIDNGKIILCLIEEDYLLKDNSFIKLTSKGYAVCDEILARLH